MRTIRKPDAVRGILDLLNKYATPQTFERRLHLVQIFADLLLDDDVSPHDFDPQEAREISARILELRSELNPETHPRALFLVEVGETFAMLSDAHKHWAPKMAVAP